jgi:uncharacterized membrane protein
MHIALALTPPWLIWLGFAALGLALPLALRYAPWAALWRAPERAHLLGAGAIACTVLWLLNITLDGDTTVHLLGLTTLTLVLGWPLSVLAGICTTLLFYLIQGLEWPGFGLSVLLTVLIPTTVSRALVYGLQKPALGNPFVYILGAGFAGGALVVLALALKWFALAPWFLVPQPLGDLLSLWPLLLLMMFSEGFINGMCVAALAVFYPQWLKTFDEKLYYR